MFLQFTQMQACLAGLIFTSFFAYVSDAEVIPELSAVLTEALTEGEFGEKEVSEAQRLLASSETEADGLEQLGWAFIDKARHGNQASCHARALACAEALESRHPERRLDSLLIRGHVLHQQHKFEGAHTIATELTLKRGNSFDHALLGDVLLDLGKVDRASDAYQKMLDLRPGLSSYLRAAEMRWITGDVQGAVDAGLLALKAGTMRQPAPLAWAYSRLSYFLWAQGRQTESEAAADRALGILPEYVPAVVAKGRALLSSGDAAGAIEVLKNSLMSDQEPLTLWLAWECYKELGDDSRVQELQKTIMTRGIQVDPRTVSLYLSTISRNSGVALQLAESELAKREDILTQDALAFALLRKSNDLEASAPAEAATLLSRARSAMDASLVHGTKDARLWLHAGLVYQATGDTHTAREFLDRAKDCQHMLYPSERRLLANARNPSRSSSLDSQ